MATSRPRATRGHEEWTDAVSTSDEGQAGQFAETHDNAVLYRLDEIERRLRDTQALVARAYEASQRWPELIAEARQEPDYETAFAGEPLVSVRVATYNASEILVRRALASLRRQTYERWEALVVGDACTDDTAERVDALNDSRIRFWNRPFRGPYPEDDLARWYVAGIPAMNEGAAAAKGAWLAPLDHDDEWDDDHIEVLLSEAQRTRSEIAYGRIRVLRETTGDEVEIGSWPPKRGDFGFLGSIYHRSLRRFEYDLHCRFADEPGDWNLARRLWEAGARFHFVDRVVATNYYTPRHAYLTTEQRMIEELRGWARDLEEARDAWRQQAEAWKAEAERPWHARIRAKLR